MIKEIQYFLGWKNLGWTCSTVSRSSAEEKIKTFMSKIEGTKIHKCIVCPQFDFSCSANLRAHVELHHYTPGYRCNACGKTFKKSKDATAHVKNCQKYYPIIDGM